jgi:site-specific DNA-methyltransferase (adenine-specific)
VAREETIGNARLILGDCREILPTLGKVDAVITDPPYGVNLTGKKYKNRRGKTIKREKTYLSYDDTPDNFNSTVVPAITLSIDMASCALVFASHASLRSLPQAAALGGIFIPQGTGMSVWGFQCFMHCVFYGRDPYLAAGKGCRPNGLYGLYADDANTIDHPCAKPIGAMKWAVNRASFAGHLILDPFMGSGTTGVAAIKLGRKFIGIEIEPKYFDIACRRIEEASRQSDMFIEQPKPVQELLSL